MAASAMQAPSLQHVSYGGPFVGFALATFMSGVVTVQTFTYYRTYPKDRIILKCLVMFLWLLDLAHLISISQFMYFYTVKHWGDVVASNKLTWSWGVEIFFGTLIIAICEFFFTFRFHIISEGNWWITSVLITLGLVQLISGIVTLGMSTNESLSGLRTYKPLGSALLFSGALNDALIALSLTYYLRKHRSYMTSPVVDRLILYAINTGALTSIVAFANIISLLISPTNLLSLAFNFPLGRLYTNAFLSSLNMRNDLNSKHWTMSFPQVSINTIYFHRDTEVSSGAVSPSSREQPKQEEISTDTLSENTKPTDDDLRDSLAVHGTAIELSTPVP